MTPTSARWASASPDTERAATPLPADRAEPGRMLGGAVLVDRSVGRAEPRTHREEPVS
jgi:hypothetical protein